MKKCPFCAEEIQDDAIKCRFCGEFLDKSQQTPQRTPWYYRTSIVIFAFLAVGPFALPLVLKNPQYSSRTKVIVTVVTLVGTYFLCVMLVKLMHSLSEYYKMIF